MAFGGKTTFDGNNGMALYLSSSIASFHAGSQVLFHNNSGSNGGAVSLMGRSYLYLDGSSNFSLVNNSAGNLGGAMYYSINLDSTVYQPCFLYHLTNSEKSYFFFSGNRAFSGRGDHIFLSSFGACPIDCNQTENVFDCIGVFTFNNPRVNTTATLPTKFGLLKEPVLLFPGIPSQLPLVANDSEGNKAPNVSYQASMAGG